ncbi:MAG: RagB/SusD family nutrient uptake outer membrane protein, partial [Bacteroidota bacterium]
MRKIFNVALVMLALAFSACTDLEIQPLSSTTSDVVFTDEESYRRFIARVYAGLAVTGQQGPAGNADISSLDEGFSNYLRQYWQLQELPTGEAVISWGDDGLQPLNIQSWTSENQFVNAMYYRIFFQVSIANEFLRESTDAKLDSRGIRPGVRSEIDTYRAEARFLRAFSYWHGIDLFGDIPFYTEEQEIGSAAPQQASRADVFNFLIEELNAIESQLPDPGAGEYARVDKAAVWMLQAKLFLNAEVYAGVNRYNECIEVCNKIISSNAYSLTPNYEHLFLADNHTSEEIIWAIAFDGDNTQTWGGMTYMTHAPVGGSMPPEQFGINGGWSGVRTTAALVDLFPDENGDLDKRAMFWTDGQSKEISNLTDFTNGYAITKWKNVTSEGIRGSNVQHIDTDYPMFRFGEVHLLYAEATLRGGNGDINTAVDYINALRRRAYGNDNGAITANDLTLDFILDERSRELYWEATRRTDLIRFGV